MKILVAPDKFKGSLSAVAAVAAISRGLRAVWPEAEITGAPIFDPRFGTWGVPVA